MRIVITGGTGFVGRAVLAEALSRGAAVTVLTRGPTAVPPGVDAVELGRGKWSGAALDAALRRLRPHAILHLAGGPRPETIEDLYEANAFLFSRLLGAAGRAAPDAQIVAVGSAAEYGPPLGADGRSSEADLARPIGAYGIAKLAQTLTAMAAAREGRPVVAARLFNPVGRGMPPGLAFADFAHQIAQGAAELVTGGIDSERDFMPVSEAARILVELLVSKDARGRIVNVASGEPRPVREGVHCLLAHAKRPIALTEQFHDGRSSGVRRIFGDTAVLKLLGIAPASGDISEALQELVASVGVGTMHEE